MENGQRNKCLPEIFPFPSRLSVQFALFDNWLHSHDFSRSVVVVSCVQFRCGSVLVISRYDLGHVPKLRPIHRH